MPKIRPLSIALVCAPLLMSACDWLRPGGPPEEALVEVSSEDVQKASLIISLNFVWAPNPDCAGQPGCDPTPQILSADTSTVDLPYSKTIKLTQPDPQLLVEVWPAAEIEATVAMRIALDGDERYNDIKLLRPEDDEGSRETLFFVYQFGGRPLDTGGGVGDG